MTTFYNDNAPACVKWLENLVAAEQLTPGNISGVSITELDPLALVGYDWVHLCAGIGGWDLALQFAGWPRDLTTWTGSFPCQPFSVAGKRKGINDDRHLWPYGRSLVEQHNPPVIFGEQVASKDGRVWLSGVRSDLEALGYVVGASDLCAAGVGAPHIRQRLYWMAISGSQLQGWSVQRSKQGSKANGSRSSGELGGSGSVGGLAYTNGGQQGNGDLQRSGEYGQQQEDSSALRLGDSNNNKGSQGWVERRDGTDQLPAGSPGLGFWSDYGTVRCADDKTRRVISNSQLLVNGFSPNLGVLCPSGTFKKRVDLLRGFGNAIVPQLAAEFVKSAMDVLGI